MTPVSDRSHSHLYAVLVWSLILVGIPFDIAILGSLLRIDPIAPFADYVGRQSPESIIILLFICASAFVALSVLVYVTSLNPFRPERPWALVYVNFLPLGVFLGILALVANLSGRDLPTLLGLSVGAIVALTLPIVPIGAEIALATVFLTFGRYFDDRGWNGPAYFFLKNSLRWRPSVGETTRRCGLLLAELGRLESARRLLARLGPSSTSDDYDVLRVLERAYLADDRAEEALQCLGRRRALRPDLRTLDRRYLAQCIALERWEESITFIESGVFEIDTELLCQLHELYLRIGNIAQAMARARQVAEKEPRPFRRAVGLYSELLNELPNNLELKIDLATLLFDTGVPEEMERGAIYLEQVLVEDVQRHHLRRRLAAFYQDTFRFAQAEQHYRKLIKSVDLDPETYLRYAGILRAENRFPDAVEVYRRMQEVCSDDWRAYSGLASAFFSMKEDRSAEGMLHKAQAVAPPSASPELNKLRRDIASRRQAIYLRKLAEKVTSEGDHHREHLDLIAELIRSDKAEQAIVECESVVEERPSALPEIQKLIEDGAETAEHAYMLKDYLTDLYLRQAAYDGALELFVQLSDEALEPEQTLIDGCLKILLQGPEHLASRMKLAGIYFDLGRWKDVLDLYGELLQEPEGEDRLKIKNQCMRAARRLGEYRLGLDIGEDILPDMKGDLDFLLELVAIYEDTTDAKGAYKVFQIAQQEFPDDERLAELEGTLARNAQDGRLKALMKLEEEGELTHQLCHEAAEIFRNFGKLDKAIVYYQRAAEDDSIRDVSMAKMAICLCDRNMYQLADETLDQVELTKDSIRARPELKNLVYRVGAIFHESADYRKSALKYFKRIFNVDAAFKDVVSRIETLGG